MKSAHFLKLLAVLIFGSVAIKAAKLPATFKRCKKNDPNLNECLKTAVQQAIRDLKSGLPALHLLPIDPISVTKIVIEEGAGRPIRLNLEFINIKAAGFSLSEIKAVRADVQNLTLETDILMPEGSFEADYIMDGQFLVLPVKGKGKCRFDYTGVDSTLKLAAEAQTKGGKTYWNVVKHEVKVKSMKSFKVKFDNLFNGDQTLSENTNRLLNENWQQLWEDMRPSLQETFSRLLQQFANEIFSRVPEEDIFLE